MAYGNPGNPGGGDGGGGDYFNDAPPAEPKMEEGEKEGSHDTGILPKTLMAGKDFKPGEEIVLKVVAVHENDFEVSYASEGGEGKEGEYKEPEAAGAPAGGGMGGMEEMMS